jgi:hypothetical protein
VSLGLRRRFFFERALLPRSARRLARFFFAADCFSRSAFSASSAVTCFASTSF